MNLPQSGVKGHKSNTLCYRLRYRVGYGSRFEYCLSPYKEVARNHSARPQFLCKRIYAPEAFACSHRLRSVDLGVRHLPHGAIAGWFAEEYVLLTQTNRLAYLFDFSEPYHLHSPPSVSERSSQAHFSAFAYYIHSNERATYLNVRYLAIEFTDGVAFRTVDVIVGVVAQKVGRRADSQLGGK